MNDPYIPERTGDSYRSLSGDDALNTAYREVSRACDRYFVDYDGDLNELALMVDATNVWDIDAALDAIETSARCLQLSHKALLETKIQWEAAFGADPNSEHHLLFPEALDHNAKKTAAVQVEAWKILATLTPHCIDDEEQWEDLRKLSVRLYDELKDLGTDG